MRVLVTGSTSLIGRHVVDRLVARGDTVTTLQRNAGPPIGGTTEVSGDIADPNSSNVVEGHDAVVHLAAKVGVSGPWEDYRRINVDGTRNLVERSISSDVRRFVHVSTPSVAHFGESIVGGSADPADPDRTRGHYATSKALAEQHVLAQASDRLAVVAIRPHLVWGPGDTQLVGRLIDRASRGRLPIIGTGAALVDSTFVDNAADAIIAALDNAPTCSGRALVVSNGEPRTVRELVERIIDAAGGYDTLRVRVPRTLAVAGGLVAERLWERLERDDDPPMTSFVAEQLSTAHWFDQRLTRQLLAWSPSVTIEEGLARLAEWSGRTRDEN